MESALLQFWLGFCAEMFVPVESLLRCLSVVGSCLLLASADDESDNDDDDDKDTATAR